MNEKELGIYLKSNKTFYVLETGNVFINSHVTRIKKKILIQKSLINMTDTSYTDSEQYEVMKIKDAIEKDYTIQKLFLNNHIKKVYESKQQEPNKW